jgi:RNA polymerase sigma factor (sigma-70 family)
MIRCRDPPLGFEFPNINETEVAMRRTNDGADDVLMNRFTAYLLVALRRTKKQYLHEITQRKTNEFPLEDYDIVAEDMNPELPVLSQVENLQLYKAMIKMKLRDLDVVLTRVVDEKSFAEIAAETGTTPKHASVIYNRTVEKIRREMIVPHELS